MKIKIIIGGLILGAIFGGSLVWHYAKEHILLSEDDKAVAILQQGMIVPEGLATVVTLTEVEKLQGQTFFQQAENGDKIILYKLANRAYLYRPSTKKVVDVTVVSVSQAPPEGQK